MKHPKLIFALLILTILQLLPVNAQEPALNHNSDSKYINMTSLSYGIGVGKGYNGSIGHSSFGIHSVNGWLISSKLSIGFGVGIDRLRITENLGQTTIPISGDLRYFFFKKPKILFGGIEGGYSINLNGTELGPNRGGFFIDPSIGIRLIRFKKVSFSASLGLRIQQNTIDYVWQMLPENDTFVNFKTGIMF